jgi:hypothetical protein
VGSEIEREAIQEGPTDDSPPAAADTVARNEVKACPSGQCEEGALLLGVMTSSGRLAYMQPPTRIDAEFVAAAKAQGRPERRFRFSTPCVEGGCPQWTGESCALGQMIVEQADTATSLPDSRLPTCAIRSSCRWYFEQGADACAVCPLIVADTGGTETYRSIVEKSAGDHAS